MFTNLIYYKFSELEYLTKYLGTYLANHLFWRGDPISFQIFNVNEIYGNLYTSYCKCSLFLTESVNISSSSMLHMMSK